MVGEVLFHNRLLLCEFLVHFEEAGDDVGALLVALSGPFLYK